MGILRLIKQVVWPEIEPPKRALPEPDKPRSVVPPALREERARLVFAVDATASRSAAWEAAKQLTDILFEAIPGKLDVALAVHGGGRVHTFTAFTDDAGRLRDMESISKRGLGRRGVVCLDRLAPSWNTILSPKFTVSTSGFGGSTRCSGGAFSSDPIARWPIFT